MVPRLAWLGSLAGIVAAASCGSGSRTAPVGPDATAPLDASPGPGQPPVLEVGYDAYRQWARLPYVRLGVRTYMRSTYDRAGGNEASDASHFVREVAPGDDVALDVQGRGILYFFRANHWHGSPWSFLIDGASQSVSETATASPDQPPSSSSFIPAAAFPSPLALTYATTQGADVSWVPMGFTTSLGIALGHSHYGTGYYVYSLYDPDAPLSQPIAAWTEQATPPADVTALLASAGSDIAPMGAGVSATSGSVDVPASGAVTVADLPGPSVVRVLRFVVPAASVSAIESAHVRITWDGRPAASVDAPVPLLFGTGTLFNRSGAEYLVKSLPAVVQFMASGVTLSTYLPMPFMKSANIEIVGGGAAAPGIAWQIRTVPYDDPPNAVGYLHATYVDQGTPTPGQDLVLLDTTKTEGGGDWCGSFVGTSFVFSDSANLGTLEGDPRFFFDDSQTPQGQGTGTEEWGAGGDYWNGQTTTLPLAGHPVGAPSAQSAQGPQDEIESAYRFLVADAFPFGKNARIQLEHGGTDDSTDHYRTLAYWYGTPSACLVQTDALHVSDAADESAHDYVSPGASTPDTLTTRYDWGVDTFGGAVVYPPTTDTGRHTTGTSELTLAVEPDNFGVLLRRKLDYGYRDQRGLVSVADGDTPGAPFMTAGVWYTAGSNQCAFVDAPTETGVAAPTVQTSDRRWRDDEFLVPSSLTRGHSHIRVQIAFDAGAPPMPVAPGAVVAPSSWSEFRYTAYSYVMPAVPLRPARGNERTAPVPPPHAQGPGRPEPADRAPREVMETTAFSPGPSAR